MPAESRSAAAKARSPGATGASTADRWCSAGDACGQLGRRILLRAEHGLHGRSLVTAGWRLATRAASDKIQLGQVETQRRLTEDRVPVGHRDRRAACAL
jgi:hypothetical protein